ncbi:MAG: cytochrome b/b6 domain-containing protein [Flavobacterium sp.]|nr:cytochrome b/b6 domain-containing protein [Flavobacterium sp.]
MNKYSKRIIWLHWVSAILIIGMAVTGIMMESETNLSFKLRYYQIHFLMGLAVFILTIFRVVAFLKDKRPSELYPNKSRQKLIHLVHQGFYWVILWMCISGFISIFIENVWQPAIYNSVAMMPNLSEGLSAIMLSHHIVAKLVFLLFILHIIGVFSHIFQKKENVLKRIL